MGRGRRRGTQTDVVGLPGRVRLHLVVTEYPVHVGATPDDNCGGSYRRTLTGLGPVDPGLRRLSSWTPRITGLGPGRLRAEEVLLLEGHVYHHVTLPVPWMDWEREVGLNKSGMITVLTLVPIKLEDPEVKRLLRLTSLTMNRKS